MQIQKINLDFSQNYYRDIVVKQNDKDSRAVIITVTDNGVKYPLDSSIHMCNVKMLTPDGRAIYNETTILSDGTIRIDFTEQMVLASGTGDLEIQIATSTETISTMHLNVVIIGSVYPDDEIIASDEFNALTAALLKVQSGGGSGGSTVVPDGVTYVDFTDSEETATIPIEQLNGITLYYTEDNILMATWDNDGTQEVQLNGSSSGTDVVVPTKVSELENDTGYITLDEVNELLNAGDKTYVDLVYEAAEIDKGEYPYLFASKSASTVGVTDLYDVYFAKSITTVEEGGANAQIHTDEYLMFRKTINYTGTAPTDLESVSQMLVNVVTEPSYTTSGNNAGMVVNRTGYIYYSTFDLDEYGTTVHNTYYRLDVALSTVYIAYSNLIYEAASINRNEYPYLICLHYIKEAGVSDGYFVMFAKKVSYATPSSLNLTDYKKYTKVLPTVNDPSDLSVMTNMLIDVVTSPDDSSSDTSTTLTTSASVYNYYSTFDVSLYSVTYYNDMYNLNEIASVSESDTEASIPTKLSELENDTGYISVDGNGTSGQFLISNGDGTVSWTSLDIAEGGGY